MDADPSDVTPTSSNRKSSAITGSARKIKDNAADWHNLMLRWDKLNGEGFSSATNIVNMRRQTLSSQGGGLGESTSVPSDQLQAVEASLQEECSRLQEVVQKMAAVLKKMERLVETQRGIQELEQFQFGPGGRTVPLFHSWTTKDFEQTCSLLLVDFRQELKLKQMILEELAHTTNPDLNLVYLSCWLHQPFFQTQTRLSLEALLLETGHRPL
ncbi:cyclin-dependent kinase 2-interacting protein [Austrofundulus limnaeus]|uniref:Cyclin-dependent kinase 2-interacting protein n=1 Tax=Austrofundulus limnaeus TaxID=52670 RepID=A0A2I4D8G1_AUSLI|nr:PREDICTED: cyclin-dependent kinase 2-interacting protein [Austrofundulus limnaeus]